MTMSDLPQSSLFEQAPALIRLMLCYLVVRWASMVVTWEGHELEALRRHCCNSMPPVVDAEEADMAAFVGIQHWAMGSVVVVVFADVRPATHRTPQS